MNSIMADDFTSSLGRFGFDKPEPRVILNKTKSRVGLCTTFHIQECRPYETIHGLKRATDEIEEALEIVCESHGLTLVQVWITYQTFAIKLTGSCIDSNNKDIKDYSDACDTFSLKMDEEGLVGKTLRTYKPHFCRNINDLSCSCFTICLRSIHTRDIDYTFEFLWPQSRNYLILFESLILTLKGRLTSFSFSSGAKLGDELRVVDVENSTRSGIACFNIFHTNEELEGRKRSPIPLPRQDVKQQSERTMKKSARNHYEWQGRNFGRRKLSEMCESQSDSIEETSSSSSCCSETYPREETLIIKAEYGDDLMAFHLPVSSVTLEVVKKKIEEGFTLNGTRYYLLYLDYEKEWIMMECEEDVRSSISCSRELNSSHVRLCVKQITSKTISSR